MSMLDAELGDIYAEPSGKLWRIIGVCRQPTIIAEEVEGHLPSPVNYGGAVQAVVGIGGFSPPAPQIVKARINGGTGGHMWDGFKRIWRREA